MFVSKGTLHFLIEDLWNKIKIDEFSGILSSMDRISYIRYKRIISSVLESKESELEDIRNNASKTFMDLVKVQEVFNKTVTEEIEQKSKHIPEKIKIDEIEITRSMIIVNFS